jgi:hypothetical protein
LALFIALKLPSYLKYAAFRLQCEVIHFALFKVNDKLVISNMLSRRIVAIKKADDPYND